METTSLQIELVYLFSKFSSLGNVYLFFILTSSLMFPWCRKFARSRFLPHSIAFDCGRLFEITLHYRLDPIIRKFHFRFVNCNDWTTIFYQFKFSLTILHLLHGWVCFRHAIGQFAVRNLLYGPKFLKKMLISEL